MEILLAVFVYLLLGCLVDMWVQKGFKMPSFIMMVIWPAFILLCAIIMSIEKREKDKEKSRKIKDDE